MNRLSYEVFLHLGQRWRRLFRPESLERSLHDLGDQDPTRLGPSRLCQEEQVILQAATRKGALAATATARRQRNQETR